MKNAAQLPTMKDVAREAGVSVGTVSNVVNGGPVSEATQKKVMAASQKLGYQVNSYARGLKTNKTYSVALILPDITHPFFAKLADEVTAALMRHGYRMILMTTNYDSEAEQNCITLVRQNKVDGIIALSYNPALEVDETIPFVTIDRNYDAKVPCVSSDNFTGGKMAAEKLIELGCKRLLFLRIGSEIPGEADKRGAGFESVCRARDLEWESIVLNDRDTEEPFYRYFETHIRNGKPDFDGIFCNTDLLACHVRENLHSLGVRVPEDVQIIGFDGIINYVTGRPYCSTFVQPVAQMARSAVQLLLEPDRGALPALLCLPVSYCSCGTTRD